MRLIALIDDPPVVRRILHHLGRWVPEPAGPAPLSPSLEWPANAVIPLTYHPLPNIARRRNASPFIPVTAIMAAYRSEGL